MSGEVSCFSRFFVKFAEIMAAGLASAISAYLLAHFGGLLSSPTPASPPTLTAVQVAPNASGVAAQPTPPAAAVAAGEHPAPQDAPDAKLVPKTGGKANVLPPRKHTKTDASVAEKKEPRNQKSAEEQVRAALANVDVNRRVPADAAIGPELTDTRSVSVNNGPPRQASVPSQQPGVLARPVDVPPRRASEPAPNAANVPLQPVQPPPAPGADLRPHSADMRTTSPSVSPVAPHPMPLADQDKDVFSALKRIPDMLRPDPSGATGEPPRPPMPVEPASPE